MVWQGFCTLKKMSCGCLPMSTRSLRVLLVLLVLFSFASVFIKYKLMSQTPPVVDPTTNIQVFTYSNVFWQDLATCRANSHDGPFKRRFRKYITCPSTTLDITLSADIEYMRVQDAVVFNFLEEAHLTTQMTKLIKLSKREKYIRQTWLIQTLESASYLRSTQPRIMSLPVHGTIGYHSNSTIRVINGHFVHGRPLSDPEKEPMQYWMDKKKHMIAWIASNCKLTFWPRMNFVKDLMNHIPVDIYGKCGPLNCLPRMSEKCLREIESYKFYLSLENSECDDYVTEKFWNAVNHGIVPIVYGPRKDYYSKVAPPNSFIYAGDYASVKELANYLLYLDKHEDEYVKYFEWRYAGKPAAQYINYCMLCDIPEIIKNVSSGRLKKQPLSTTAYYDSCRPQEGGVEYNTHVDYSHWTPWK